MIGCRSVSLRKLAKGRGEPEAAVGPDLFDERLAVALEGARAPVRALEPSLTFHGAFDRLQLVEGSGHLVWSQVGAPGAVLSEIEAVGVPRGEPHDTRPGPADP